MIGRFLVEEPAQSIAHVDLHLEGGVIVVSGVGCNWGVPCSRVARILDESAWSGTPPVDVDVVSGLPVDRAAEPHRVLVIPVRRGGLVLRAAGKTEVRMVDPAMVYPLPEIVLPAKRRRLFAGVVLAEKQTPLFLLDVAALGQLLLGTVPVTKESRS